jgi:hypothetical protein
LKVIATEGCIEMNYDLDMLARGLLAKVKYSCVLKGSRSKGKV